MYVLKLIYFDSKTQETKKSNLKTSASSKFPPLHLRNAAKAGLFRKRLHVFVTSFKRQNDVTPSNDITNITCDDFSVVNDIR